MTTVTDHIDLEHHGKDYIEFLKYNGREIYQVGGEMCHDLICIFGIISELEWKKNKLQGAKVDTERQKEALQSSKKSSTLEVERVDKFEMYFTVLVNRTD